MNKILIGTLLALSTIVISGVSINHLKKSADNTSANTSNIPESITKDNLRFALKDDIIKLIPLMKQIVEMKDKLTYKIMYPGSLADYRNVISELCKAEPIPSAVELCNNILRKLLDTGLFAEFPDIFSIKDYAYKTNILDAVNTTTNDYHLFCCLIYYFGTMRPSEINMSHIAHKAEDILQVLIRLNELSEMK